MFTWIAHTAALFIILADSLLIPVAGHCTEKLIAVTEVWPPFRIEAPESERGFRGIDIDIVDRLAEYLDIEIEIQRHPFARALEMIKTGEADLITGIAFSETRDEFIVYIPTSYFAVGPVFYTQKGRGDRIETYDDLYGLKIGYSLHSVYFEPFNSDEGLNKIGIPTEEQLIKMVALNRLDATVGTNPNLAYDISRYGLKDRVEKTHYIPADKTPLYLGLSQKHQDSELKNKIDEFLGQLLQSGEIIKIVSTYQ